MKAAVALALVVALSGCAIVGDALGEGESGVFTLAVGDCLNDAAEGDEVTSVPRVDCAGPHDSELYAATTIDVDEYPGLDAVVTLATTFCRDAFEGFVGIPSIQSRYQFGSLYPTAESWAGGDREVLCRIALVDRSGTIEQVTGSLEGVAD